MEVYLKLLLVCAVIAASESFGCIKTAQKSANGVGMMGGWRKQTMATADDYMQSSVEGYTREALAMEDMTSNDLYTGYVVADDNDPLVYTQIVNGMKYCIKFEAESTHCSNSSPNCRPHTKTCVVEVYELPGDGILVMGQPVNASNIQNVKCRPT